MLPFALMDGELHTQGEEEHRAEDTRASEDKNRAAGTQQVR